MNTKKLRFNSKLIHAGEFDDGMGSATVPIYQTSTFSFKNSEHGAKCFADSKHGYVYTRIGNPTIEALENAVSELENGFGGIATASGMGAITSVYSAFLSAGSHIVSHDALYGPARGVIETIYKKFGVEYTYLDASDTAAVENAIQENTSLVYIETPANPTMGIMDIEAIAKITKARGIPLVVDNTFCSPVLQNPIDLGADVVIHSMTKFINGHADIVAGMIVTKDEELYKKVRSVMVTMGCNMDPHQAYLVLRGLKTLGVRVERAQENAKKVAAYLNNHPKIEWLIYPGLKSHPQYELAQRQMKGPGAMISFELKGGYEAGKILMDNVQLALLAVSLGGVETLIQHPASMTHSKLSKESRIDAGITDGLVRFAIGIEDVDDIIEDMKQALEKVPE